MSMFDTVEIDEGADIEDGFCGEKFQTNIVSKGASYRINSDMEFLARCVVEDEEGDQGLEWKNKDDFSEDLVLLMERGGGRLWVKVEDGKVVDSKILPTVQQTLEIKDRLDTLQTLLDSGRETVDMIEDLKEDYGETEDSSVYEEIKLLEEDYEDREEKILDLIEKYERMLDVPPKYPDDDH